MSPSPGPPLGWTRPVVEPLWTSAAIAAATGGRALGGGFAASGIGIDSRALRAGDLFVALTAERDGHDFIAAAMAGGAAAVLAGRPVDAPCVIVGDTLVGLCALAEAARLRAPDALRGAVTGSVGKTSVTQAVLSGLRLAAVAGSGAAHGPIASFNNHIGVPLTLARMPADTRRAIFEIGMNHAGEIAPLSRLLRPHVVAITTVAAAHMENFADGEAGIARAKAEIFEGLAPRGVAVINADDPWFDYLAAEACRRRATLRRFGAADAADARLIRFTPTPEGAMVAAMIDGARLDYSLRQSAVHWGPMSLCALLILRALDVDLATAVAALSAFEPLHGRGALTAVRLDDGTFTLVDESYNASPVSMSAALRTLGRAAGRRIAVLTDMLELGVGAADHHVALAGVIEAADVDLVFCAGPLMKTLWAALPSARQGCWAPDAGALAPALIDEVRAGDTVMVKGSHGSRAAVLVDALSALDKVSGGRG